MYPRASLHHSRSRVLRRCLSSLSRSRGRKERGDCVYFCRFGKCHKGSSCPFVHNPTKVAVCTRYSRLPLSPPPAASQSLTSPCLTYACSVRFLRGTCRDAGCLFSHKTIPEKVPVCEYYLRGICCRDPCPYRHVNVGRTASVCQNFVRFGQCYEKDVSASRISFAPELTPSPPSPCSCVSSVAATTSACVQTSRRQATVPPRTVPCVTVDSSKPK